MSNAVTAKSEAGAQLTVREAIATAIYEEPTLTGSPMKRFAQLSDERRAGWLGDADRVLAVLPQVAALTAALEEAVAVYGKPGGPWNVPSDPGGWLSRALAALNGSDERIAA